MKKIGVVIIVFFALLNAQAQDLNKQVVKEKIDKHTEMAYVYQNDILVEKGKLIDGKRDGVWQSFNENGTLITEASFSNGLKEGMWMVYNQAALQYVLYYENDVRVKANDLAAK